MVKSTRSKPSCKERAFSSASRKDLFIIHGFWYQTKALGEDCTCGGGREFRRLL